VTWMSSGKEETFDTTGLTEFKFGLPFIASDIASADQLKPQGFDLPIRDVAAEHQLRLYRSLPGVALRARGRLSWRWRPGIGNWNSA